MQQLVVFGVQFLVGRCCFKFIKPQPLSGEISDKPFEAIIVQQTIHLLG